MDFSSTHFLKMLFDGQGDLNPRETLAAGNSGLTFLLQDHPYGCILNKSGRCPTRPLQSLDEKEPEDPLQLWMDPNDVYKPRSSSASPESERGGVSGSPCRDNRSPPIILEVLCDPGTQEDTAGSLLVSNPPFESCSPPESLPSACSASRASLDLSEAAPRLKTGEVPADPQLQCPGVFLTDEERRLLSQEGVFLQDVLYLSQVDERILKKIRRKIRNKQSAQDSRRRKKEYLDGLESRVAACSSQNQDLKKAVHQLEKHQESLLDQLQKLQGLLKETSSKAAQTGTCLVIFLVSFGLFILPSCTSLLGREDHNPSGVLSRNILTQKGASELVAPSATHLPEVPPVRRERSQEPQSASIREDEAEKNLPVGGESATEEALEPRRDPRTQPKGRWRGKATGPDLDEI